MAGVARSDHQSKAQPTEALLRSLSEHAAEEIGLQFGSIIAAGYRVDASHPSSISSAENHPDSWVARVAEGAVLFFATQEFRGGERRGRHGEQRLTGDGGAVPIDRIERSGAHSQVADPDRRALACSEVVREALTSVSARPEFSTPAA